MGRCADVLQAAQSLATCAVGIGPPDEELVDGTLPAVWVAAHKVDVHRFQISSWKVVSTGEIVRPFAIKKAAPRHAIRPPSVTMKDGMAR